MKFQFPRHLFTPLLIYDAAQELNNKPSQVNSPQESRTVRVKIQPIIQYTSDILQTSKSVTDQSITQISTFKIQVVGNGELTVNGETKVNQTLNAYMSKDTFINETILNRITTEVPPLFANLQLSGPTTAQDPNLWMSIDFFIKDTIRQENLIKIIQDSFDITKATLYIRGKFNVQNIDSDQTIITKLIATNIIQAIIDNSNNLIIAGDDDNIQNSVDGSARIYLITGVLITLCSVLICMIILFFFLRIING